jgi:rhomboid family protein
VTSGLAAWFFAPPGSFGAGASGVVFGYFGYIMVRGLFDRHSIDVLIGAVMALCFAYQFSVLLPHQGIGWQAHVGGIAGGILSGWIFRDRRAAQARRAAAGAGAADAQLDAGTDVAVRSASTASLSGTASGKSGTASKAGKKKGYAVDPSNPRADLYKELDDLGL